MIGTVRGQMRRQFLMIIIARGLGSCLQAILLIAYARTVDPAVFGLTNALLGIAAIASVVSDLGITTYIVRVWAFDRDPGRVKRALRVNHVSTLCLAVGLTVIFAISSLLGDTPVYLCLISLWVALEKSAESYLSVHIAEQDVLVPTVSLLIRRILPLGIYLALVSWQVDAVMALVISLGLGGIAGQVHVAVTLPPEFRLPSRSIPLLSIIRESKSFGIANLASQMRNADTFLVGLVAGLAAGGSFAAATKLTIPIYLIASALASSVMPAVARSGRGAVMRIAIALYGALGVGAIGVFLALPWLDRVMIWIFGPAYGGAGQLLCLILLGTLVASVGFPISALLQAVGLSNAVAGIEGATAVFVLIGITLGAVVAGAEGAAAGALGAQTLRATLLSIRLFRWNTTSIASWRNNLGEGIVR